MRVQGLSMLRRRASSLLVLWHGADIAAGIARCPDSLRGEPTAGIIATWWTTSRGSTFTNSLKLLRQARERLGQGLPVEAGGIAESDEISLRNP